MNINCIILARKNSKRIFNKNTINFKGKPLIYWTIKQSLRIKNIKRIILSSDSKQILDITKKISKKIILNKRPRSLSSSKTKSEKVIKYLIKKYKFNSKNYILLLQPTSPLRKDKDINKVIKIVKNKNLLSLHSANRYKGKKIINSKINIFNTSVNNKEKRKNLSYNGSIYLFRSDLLIKHNSIYEKTANIYITDRKNSLDIDNYSDLKIY